MARNRRLLAAIAVLTLAAVAQAAYLESDSPDRPTPPPPVVIVAPLPRPDDPLTQMVRRLTVREGYHWGGLTVFLVDLRAQSHHGVYLTTQEALDAGVLSVREKRRAEVPSLIVQNTGRTPVLMLGGELLLGGKQNRTLAQDVLLPARSGPIAVPVRCTEERRWSGTGTDRFNRSSAVAVLGARQSAVSGKSQQDVWRSVSRYQESFKAASNTRDLDAIQRSPEVARKLDEFRTNFRRHCWRPRAIGMVVARWGVIVGADLFANARLFEKHRDRLLDSYATDCISYHRGRGARHRPSERRGAERFLRRVLRARIQWRSTPGMGRALSVRGVGIEGSALVLRHNVVHAALFPEAEVIIVPPPRPMPQR